MKYQIDWTAWRHDPNAEAARGAKGDFAEFERFCRKALLGEVIPGLKDISALMVT